MEREGRKEGGRREGGGREKGREERKTDGEDTCIWKALTDFNNLQS